MARRITAAIVADLNDPDRVIKPGPGWRKINSSQELEAAYKGGSATKTRAGMKLYRLQGDDGEIWATSSRLGTNCPTRSSMIGPFNSARYLSRRLLVANKRVHSRRAAGSGWSGPLQWGGHAAAV